MALPRTLRGWRPAAAIIFRYCTICAGISELVAGFCDIVRYLSAESHNFSLLYDLSHFYVTLCYEVHTIP